MASTRLAAIQSIIHRDKPSYEEFQKEHLVPRKPAVIRGALGQWKALSLWTPDFFKNRYGSILLVGKNQRYTYSGFMPTSKSGESLTMGEFIDLVLASSEQNPAPYLRNVHLEKFLPELYADVLPIPQYLSPNWLTGPFARLLESRLHGGRFELYIGGRGGKFPTLHFDTWHIHTFLCQVHGIKEYTIFSPEDGPYLYANGHVSSLPDVGNVDLEKFPLFAKANPIRFQLHPGEILFVPAGWWHTTKMLSPSITVSASRVNDSNWKDFSRDMRTVAPPHLKPLVAAYLASLQIIQKNSHHSA
jgi:histone arginine demethylase JMJD6